MTALVNGSTKPALRHNFETLTLEDEDLIKRYFGLAYPKQRIVATCYFKGIDLLAFRQEVFGRFIVL